MVLSIYRGWCHFYHIYRLLDSLLNFSSRATIICFKSEFSFFKTSTSLFNAPFSSSRYLARMAIWFSLSLLASRERLAASLFLYLLAQYLLFFSSSGTNCFFLFLMIGWGLSSSSENLRVAGSKSWNVSLISTRVHGGNDMRGNRFWNCKKNLRNVLNENKYSGRERTLDCREEREIKHCDYLYLPRDGGEPQVVLTKVDADCGGEASKVATSLVIFVLSEVGAVWHLPHAVWSKSRLEDHF